MQLRAPTAPAGLLEREREFARLEQAVAEAATGAGSVVAIEGEAGIGKSSLMAHASRCACDADMRVLSARGGELEREFPYGIVRQLFESAMLSVQPAQRARWLSGAAGLAAPLVTGSAAAAGPGADASSMLHGLYWLTANVAGDGPLLIAVDDAHWADDASVAFLTYLARRVNELAVAIVCAARAGEGANELLPAVADPAVVAVVLRPPALSESASTQLVAGELARAGSEAFARACHSATSGNPFLLKELLRALAADGVLPEDANTTRVGQIAPATIARATIARLRRLGRDAENLAFAVAVLGRSAELRHAAALAGLDCDRAAVAADALAAAAILRASRPLEFIHPIVRTTIYHELATGRRAASHKRAARMLEHDGAGDMAIAPHLLCAEPSGDSWVVERLRGAAREVVRRGAPEAACTYLERAEREPPPAGERLAVLLELGTVELTVGRPAAVGHLREVTDAADDEHMRFDAARELFWALKYSDRAVESVALGAEVLAGAARGDSEMLLRLEAEITAAAQFAPASARAALERVAHYEVTLRGETIGERQMLACLACRSAHRGESAAATAELARRAIAGERLLHEHRPASAPFFLAVWALIYADCLDEAERCFDAAVRLASSRGSAAAFATASGSHCHVLLRQGRLAEAEAEALGVLTTIEPHALHAIAKPMLLSCLLQATIERSQPATWAALLREYGLDDLSGSAMAGMLLDARGQMRLEAGDASAALNDFERLHERNELSGLDTPGVSTRAARALAHLQLGELEQARTLAGEELARARRWAAPSRLSIALRAAGLVAGGDDGIALLREAATVAEGSPARYEHARALMEYGAALRRAGHRRDARGPLRAALDLAHGCGATRLARRTRDELVASGARPRRVALSGRDALTPSERRVAQLAAEGLSNREIAQSLFVTVRTVEGHLTQTYMKLGIASREQLSPALAAGAEAPGSAV